MTDISFSIPNWFLILVIILYIINIAVTAYSDYLKVKLDRLQKERAEVLKILQEKINALKTK